MRLVKSIVGIGIGIGFAYNVPRENGGPIRIYNIKIHTSLSKSSLLVLEILGAMEFCFFEGGV